MFAWPISHDKHCTIYRFSNHIPSPGSCNQLDVPWKGIRTALVGNSPAHMPPRSLEQRIEEVFPTEIRLPPKASRYLGSTSRINERISSKLSRIEYLRRLYHRSRVHAPSYQMTRYPTVKLTVTRTLQDSPLVNDIFWQDPPVRSTSASPTLPPLMDS